MSLRRRFVLVLASFAVVLAVAFGYLTWRIASDALEAELDRRVVDVPRGLVASGAIQDDVMSFTRGMEDTERYVAYRARLDSLRTFVHDAFVFNAVDNSVLVSPDREMRIGDPLGFLRAYPREISRALGSGTSTTRTVPGPEGQLYKYGFVRVSPDSNIPAILAVQVPAEFFEPLARLNRTLLAGTLVALLVAVALAAVLAGNIVGPLERLSRVALRIQRGHMDQEVELERADELGRLSRAMERMREGILERDERLRLMLAQVAHEIRNPLGGLELFASAAAEAEEPSERRRLIGRVRSEVDGLNRIIDDFLTFARPSGGERRAEDVRQAVREAAELVRGDLESEGVELETSVDADPLLAVVDADRVKRAVLNLLRNAAHAAEGRIWLEAGRRGSEIEVVVRDDGPGLPEAMRDRVFDPFVTDKEKGAGLGLAIVRKVVEDLDGRVEVGEPDAVGRGAEFRLYFPGLEEPPPNPRSPDASASP